MDWLVSCRVSSFVRWFVRASVTLSDFHFEVPETTAKSNPRDLWPLKHLIRVMRRQKGPTCAIFFLNSLWFKDVRNYIPKYLQIQEYKYKYKHKYKYSLWSSTRMTQQMLYFWIAGGSMMSKVIFPSVRFTYEIWDLFENIVELSLSAKLKVYILSFFIRA